MLTFKDRRIKVWAEYDIAKEKETERRRSKQRPWKGAILGMREEQQCLRCRESQRGRRIKQVRATPSGDKAQPFWEIEN